MDERGRSAGWVLTALAVFCLGGAPVWAGPVRVATFNVLNYLPLDRQVEGRYRPAYPKPESEKAALRAIIRAVRPDVLALQEMGPAPYLEELRQDLAREGMDLAHHCLLDAADPERHVAVLSRLPFAEVVPHRDLRIDYLGESVPVKRGLLEVRFGDAAGAGWTLFVVHLKSRYTDRPEDPRSAQRRLLEARAVRARILQRHPDPARDRVVLAGDFNDTPDSPTLAAFLQRGGPRGLYAVPAADSRGETWTHHFRRAETYTRVDFVLVSGGLRPAVVDGRGRVFDRTDGPGEGSDHRLVWVDLDFRSLRPPDPEESD